MSLKYWSKWLFLGLLMVITTVAQSATEKKQKALKIQTHLEQQLYTLPLKQQGKWALMLYRSTGKKVYLNTALVSLFLAADRLQRLAGYMTRKVDQQAFLLEQSFPVKPELQEEFLDYFFYGFQVLPELLQINRFSMTLKGGLGESIERGVSRVDVSRALTSQKMQEYYAPEMAKHVYALLTLGFGDYRRLFIETFQMRYSNKKDHRLSPKQRSHKWLTMTHLVLAASDQLQEPVNDPALNWIPEYFQARKEIILAESNDLLLAKIGLSLLLTGHKTSTLLESINTRLSERPEPNSIGQTDLWCMLLLGWVDNYYPDPALYQITKFKHKTPYILKPVE